MIAKVAVAAAGFAIDKPYSYRIPMPLSLQAGMRVVVPFGRGNRPSEGVVLEVCQGQEDGLKPVTQCLDEEPMLTDRMLRLGAFMRQRYFCSFYEAVRAMLPASLWFRSTESFSLTEDRSWKEAIVRQKDAKAILEQLENLGAEAAETVLRQVVTDEEAFDKAIRYLLGKKWIRSQTDYSNRTRDKVQKLAVLAVPAEEAMAYAATRPKSAAMQRSVLETLCAVGSVSVKELCYFTGAGVQTVKRLESLGYVALQEQPVLRCRQIIPQVPAEPLVLNEEQQAAFDGLYGQLHAGTPGGALLYGVTGSGKTSVYLKLIQSCLDMGKAAVLLVPEIALTPQLLGLLTGYFGQTVAVLHSSLPAAERYDQWKRIRSGDAKVVVGTRSAVFAPCPDLGLMILDEEQEHSYKSENTPRYCAKEIAQWRGWKENALVLFGSATPSVETMYRAKQGELSLYRLQNRYNGKGLPAVQIVDMREELKDGNDLSISIALMDGIRRTRAANRQTILFLNRRGNSRALVCVDCATAPQCPRCNARLTYHSANERLMCHYCGFSQPVPVCCPSCGGHLKRTGTGTQKVQQELLELEPDMPVLRMDADTVSATNTHEMILRKFREENIPVLIGTQMVAKGLNMPNVTLVGVLDADLGLYVDSYRGAETTFNMLTQVVGRAGRGENAGCAMIQTLVPEHKVIKLAARQDYDSFYELEIGLRRLQNVPPFADLTCVTFTGLDEATVLRSAVKFRDSLLHCLGQDGYRKENCSLLGPAACPVPKINYHFRYRLMLRCALDQPLRQLLAHLMRQFFADKSNRGISCFADVNGFD